MYVAPYARTSSRNRVALNFRASAIVAHPQSAGASEAMIAFEWNSGIAQ